MPQRDKYYRPPRHLPWRFRLVVLLFIAALFLPTVVGWTRGAIQCRLFGGGSVSERQAAVPGSNLRPEEQTYLTLPEWYIVYSADEYAAYLAVNRPSGFPYFQSVGQYWQAYYDVCTVTRDRYPFNFDYQLTLAVIGASFTAENVFKGLYENSIGRLSEWSSTGEPTPEEVYGHGVAAEYGTFIHTTPWYEFPFSAKIGPLWAASPSEPNLARKVERRLALTLEYAVKAGYGWVIKQATGSAFEPDALEITAKVEGVSPELLQRVWEQYAAEEQASSPPQPPAGPGQRKPELRIVEQPSDGRPALVAIPRYEAFTRLVPRLVNDGVRFVEIAGNDEIMLTVLAPRDWKPGPDQGELLFSMPVLTRSGQARYAVRVPVAALHTVVGSLTRPPAGDAVVLEHIYDY
jgi:hypothetical protein